LDHIVLSNNAYGKQSTMYVFALSLSLSLSLSFIGHFPGEPGLAGVYWSKGWCKWWWQL